MRRCLVADDHPGVLLALADWLGENGFEVVTARDGPTAVRLAEDRAPDCAVVDYRMPGLDGTELVTRLRAAAPGAALVIYTAEASHRLCADARATGAGAVLKEAPLGDVLQALRAGLGGKRFVDARIARLELDGGPAALSKRESEVLALVSEGLDYREIGSRLGIGCETARTHLRKACLRLGAATRTQAVARALRLGWIE